MSVGLSSPGERFQRTTKDETDNMTGHTHRAAQMISQTPTAMRPEGARPYGRPCSPRDGCGRAVSNGRGREPGPGARALWDKAPERGDNANQDWIPGPPRRGLCGDAEPEGPQGQTAVGPEGIGRRTPTTCGCAEGPNPSSSRPTPPGGPQGGRPGDGQSPRACGGVGTSMLRGLRGGTPGRGAEGRPDTASGRAGIGWRTRGAPQEGCEEDPPNCTRTL